MKHTNFSGTAAFFFAFFFTVTPTNPLDSIGAGKACACYLDNDCNSPLVCHTGVSCSEGKHSTKPQNPDFISLTNNIGLCKEYGPLLEDDPDLPYAYVAELYIAALEVSGAYQDDSGDGGPRNANEAIVARALAYAVGDETHSTIRSLVTHIVMLVIGPADSVNINFKHRSGFYEPPGVVHKEDYRRSKLSFAVASLGAVYALDEPTLAALAIIRQAVFLEIREPNVGLFGKEILRLRETLPDHKTFSACEYPHPPEHGHKFIFTDGIDCLSTQIMDALENLNGVQRK